MKSRLYVLAFAIAVLPRIGQAVEPQDEIRATFEKFVAAQNAHDLKALEPLLLDSPQFLWITSSRTSNTSGSSWRSRRRHSSSYRSCFPSVQPVNPLRMRSSS